MKIIYSLIFLIAFTACNSASNSSAATDSSSKTETSQTPNSENYTGTLPCADCEGINVSLLLNKDETYTMNSVYKGSRVDSNHNSFKDTGTWNLHGTDTIYLTAKNNSIIKYIKTDTTLTQLDGDGNIITGPLAEMFVLHKN